MFMRKKKTIKVCKEPKITYYALRVIDPIMHTVKWVAIDNTRSSDQIFLVDEIKDAKLYPNNVEKGHGTPDEWAEMISETMGWKIVRATGTTFTPN